MALDPKWKAILLDFLERAGWTAGQVFIATLLAGGTSAVTDLPWRYSLTLAASSFVLSLVLTAGQYVTSLTDLRFWPDLLTRLAKTFLGTLGSSMVAAGIFDVTTFEWEAALNVAVLATLGALAKGLLAREPATPNGRLPTGASPSTLPMATYQTAIDGGGTTDTAGPARRQ